MINSRMQQLGEAPSAIREMYMYGLQRKQEIGEGNVFDYSIGNPTVPAPEALHNAIRQLMEQDATSLHGYTVSMGDAQAREAIAANLRARFGAEMSADAQPSAQRLYLTCGAAASLAISLSAVTRPGEEVILVAPFFPEYRIWIESAGCTVRVVPARPGTFQIDTEALAAAIGEKTAAVIINTPNNPTGTVYTRENLQAFAAVLAQKEAELGRSLYVISDEPYRELTYGAEVPWVPGVWPRTLVCYSWSKSFSLPGERIGYIYVSDAASDAAAVYAAVSGAGRALGYVNAPALWQRAVAACIDEPVNVEAYRQNRQALTKILSDIGYEYVEPDGAFYLWVKALEPNAQAFSDRARNFELLIVPSDGFGVSGWVRASYCVGEIIEPSRRAWQALFDSYQQ